MRILAVLTLVAILIGATAVIAAPAVDTKTQPAIGDILDIPHYIFNDTSTLSSQR